MDVRQEARQRWPRVGVIALAKVVDFVSSRQTERKISRKYGGGHDSDIWDLWCRAVMLLPGSGLWNRTYSPVTILLNVDCSKFVRSHYHSVQHVETAGELHTMLFTSLLFCYIVATDSQNASRGGANVGR